MIFWGLFLKKIKTGALAVSMATIPEFPEFFKIISGQIKSDGRRHTRCVHPVVAIFHFFFCFQNIHQSNNEFKEMKTQQIVKKGGNSTQEISHFSKEFHTKRKRNGLNGRRTSK